MTTSVAARKRDDVVRPLHVLVPLIKADIAHGKQAADQAGMPYYRAAGEKMLEAKPQIDHGKFQNWIKRHFTITYETARRWMRLAEDENTTGVVFSSITDHVRETSNPNYNRPSSWHEPVQQIIGRVDTETLNLKQEELKRSEEREAQRKLALQLIDIGYKVLAKTLHPDKGGSRAAMARLNAVRDRLKQCI